MTCEDRDKKIQLLERQVAILQESNYVLAWKLDELLQHHTILAGLKGEKLILEIAKGSTTKKNASYDIRLSSGGKVEVKYSRTSEPNPGTPTCRWVWNGLAGERQGKDYDVLVLIGDKDGAYHKFEEDESSFVYFILNKGDVSKIMNPGGRRGWVALNINPSTTRSIYSKQLWQYKVSAQQARDFFDQLAKKEGADCGNR